MPTPSCDISVIVPVFNEETNIRPLWEALNDTLPSCGKTFEVLFVDDGSVDHSFEALKELHARHSGQVRVVRFARNFGHQLAITAGLNRCNGRAAVIMDCDLQDPPAVILDFIQRWEEGYRIVYGIRIKRKGEGVFKKLTAKLFYRLMRLIAKIDLPADVGDFYLLDRVVIEELNGMRERHRFLRGLIAWLGYKKIGVPYEREPRFSGQTKYPFWKMIKFAFDAVTAFSFFPLRLASVAGGLIASVAFLGIVVTFYLYFFTDYTITGWSSLMVAVLFMGGIQLLALGLIGEYLARIGDDTKNRPLYTVQEYLG